MTKTIEDVRVELAGKATKEWVGGAFFLALIAQFVGFLVIANMTVDPVKEDVTELKQDVKDILRSQAAVTASLKTINATVSDTQTVLATAADEFNALDARMESVGMEMGNLQDKWQVFTNIQGLDEKTIKWIPAYPADEETLRKVIENSLD